MIIEFITIQKKILGRAEQTDGKVVATTPEIQFLLDGWLADGKSEEEFMEYFKSWSSGYMASYEVSDTAE